MEIPYTDFPMVRRAVDAAQAKVQAREKLTYNDVAALVWEMTGIPTAQMTPNRTGVSWYPAWDKELGCYLPNTPEISWLDFKTLFSTESIWYRVSHGKICNLLRAAQDYPVEVIPADVPATLTKGNPLRLVKSIGKPVPSYSAGNEGIERFFESGGVVEL
jgi:hypothetical protein